MENKRWKNKTKKHVEWEFSVDKGEVLWSDLLET